MTEKVNPAVQVQLSDLYAVVQIIDACVERGSFKGAEMEVVGGVRNRLKAFVDANQLEMPEAEDSAEVEK